ncbi:ATP synthase F1 [Colletotrichum lupini]|uniref:Serine protease n=1 Tax=Colletotrichum lupini TaxID=145971 RepID=A0A9Q8SZI4_9PEZI|nr:ATP synthase F1 [Colletotrichum lupini]UQC86504.1 ATP synthase F1 [Colletotrichum lupini]
MSYNAPSNTSIATSGAPRAAVWSLKSSNPDLPAESAILPDDGSNGTESVFDDDKRRRVEPQSFADGGKFRSVVKIQACFNKGNGSVWMMGSGWLISPDTVVTAGHVVYDWGHRLQSATEIKCYIGYSGRASIGTPNVQARFGERIITTAEWIEAAGNRRHDVAFIKVNRPFTGNLRNIPFKETPLFAKNANIGVVGYPGDKYLEGQNGQSGEKGAQIPQFPQAQRQGIKVLTANGNARPSSNISASNGAPSNGQVKNGSAPYSNGYGNGNTYNGNGNGYSNGASNGHSNGYNGFRQENVSSPPQPTHYNSGTGLQESSDEEGFLDIIRSIAKVAGPVVSTVTPFLGPIGGPIGAIAGGILSTVGGAESALEDGNATAAVETAINSGATERAVLAEASLQALLKLEDTPETAEILHTINSKYNAFRPKLDAIAKVAQPQLTEAGLHLAHRQMAKIQERGASGFQESDIELPREQLRGLQYNQQGSQGAFVQGLLAPTRPVSGEEGFFDSLGSVLSKGISFAKPFIASAAQGALSGVIGRLGGGAESSFDTPAVGSHEYATLLAFKRAAAAEAALQTLMALPKEKLDRLRVSEPQNGEEGFFDVIKAGVQKIAPSVLDIAKTAMRKVVPVIVDAASQKIKSAVGQESANSAPRNNVTSTTSVIRTKRSVLDLLTASDQSYKGAKVSNSPDDSDHMNATLEELLKSRESTWVPSLHKRKSWDSNDDGLCMMDDEDL